MTKVEFLRRYFVHRGDAYAVMCWSESQKRDNYYDRVFDTLTDDVLQKHVDGGMTVAIFPTLVEDQTVRFCCWDIDKDVPRNLDKILSVCGRLGMSYLLEKSGAEDRLHVWSFYEEPQLLTEVRKLVRECAMRGIDFFPERDVVIADYYYELPVKLPLGFHRQAGEWSKFVDRDLEEIDFDEVLEIIPF